MLSPATPRRPSDRGSAKSTPTRQNKPLDIGQPLGVYDTNSVREKVRKWQQQGGGVVTTIDVCADSDEGDNAKDSRTEVSKGSSSRVRSSRLKVEEKKHDDKSQEGKENDRKERSRSTPRKRVVSDEHWRKNRSTPNKQSPNVTPRRRGEVVSKYTDSAHPFKEKNDEPYKGGSETANPKRTITDDGIRVYETPRKTTTREPRHRKSRENTEPESTAEDNGPPLSTKKPRDISSRGQAKPKTTELRKKELDVPDKKLDDEWTSQISDPVYFSEQENRPVRQEQRTTPNKDSRPAKGRILTNMFDESKKMFRKNEPAPPSKPKGSSVEAWLSSTPDPFVEDDPFVHMPAPLNSSRKERRSPEASIIEGGSEVTSQNSTDRVNGHVSRSNRRRPKSAGSLQASEPSNLSRDIDEEPPLRRRDARGHSKSFSDGRGMSTLRESVEEALQESTLDHHSSDDTSEVSSADRPPPLTLRRPFPSTGAHRLSTIASVDTLNTSAIAAREQDEKSHVASSLAPKTQIADDHDSESEARDQFDPDSLPGQGTCGLKRRLTKHSDLISVLSIPGAGTRSIRSARSIRTNRSRLATATIGDLMQELSSDEAKYIRELRTLVGGVIPVLLTCVLSKSESAVAAGLFSPSAKPHDDVNFTRPIINMGVSLERLKSLHKRIPLDNAETLLAWAQGAQRTYSDYLNAWRLGFQDVVVNLAPPDPSKSDNAETQSLYAGMEQDEDGDVINGDGEKVDVAFLLKRPLVRLKYLAKTFKGINFINPSPKASEVAMAYQKLVTDARRRFNEEKARLEDDAAASIDASRARSPRTMEVLSGVTINQTRRVKARDTFDLSMLHSSGQEIDCRAELLIRDNPPEAGPGGDLLICEMDNTGRWLLFPPIDSGRASARSGDKGELVVMIRGVPGEEADWKELFSLKAEDEQIALEWVHLIGLSPVPPKINRSLSFVNRAKKKRELPPASPDDVDGLLPSKEPRGSTPTKMDVPFGEQATVLSYSTRSDTTREDNGSVSGIQSSSSATTARDSLPSQKRRSMRLDTMNDASPKTPTGSPLPTKSPKSLNEAMAMAGGASPTSGLKRTKAQRRSKYGELSMHSPTSSIAGTPERELGTPEHTKNRESGSPEPKSAVRSSRGRSNSLRRHSPDALDLPNADFAKPMGKRSLSPVPSLELPTIPKLRKKSSESNEQKSSPLSQKTSYESPTANPKPKQPKTPAETKEDAFFPDDNTAYLEEPPPPPPHRSSSPVQSRQSPTPPVLSPTTPRHHHNRRGSSPLKHEYEPSTATETSESDASTVAHQSSDSDSDTSDEDLEGDDIATPLPPIANRRNSKVSPPSSLSNIPDATLGPSNSASQAPYKTVPSQPSKASKAIASIYYWHDKGTWEGLHPDECSIVITPGLIEAYEMSVAHSQPAGPQEDGTLDPDQIVHQGDPLIALELTPLVPIRRGTALDISIRSPPTERSRLKAGNNVMFRSRNPEECEKLYNLINHSRINNPTYIALQNARGSYSMHNPSMGRQNSTRSNSKLGGLFSWNGSSRKSSYRASSAPSQSVAGVTDSSVGTMASAFSALKRFGAGSKMFNIARSTITSRTGSRGGSLYSSSAGSGGNSSSASPFEGAEGAKNAAGAMGGLGNAKIRLYRRETASKWRDMGAARLTILPASSPVPTPPGTAGNPAADPATDPSTPTNGATPDFNDKPPAPVLPVAANSRKKRILIRGKTHGEVLLDAVLGETCFERVARTGIAVSVWEEFDGVAKEGGVVGGSFSVYMIQMKSEAETAYTFGLVGKLRY